MKFFPRIEILTIQDRSCLKLAWSLFSRYPVVDNSGEWCEEKQEWSIIYKIYMRLYLKSIIPRYHLIA